MLQQKQPLVTFKTKLDAKTQCGPHRPRSFSVPLTAFDIEKTNGTTLKKYVYMSSRDMCHKVSNWSAITTRNILMQLLQLLLASNGQDFNLTLRDLRCFCIFYEKCAINFDPNSLVLIFFGLIFVISNMISHIHLIVKFVWGPFEG